MASFNKLEIDRSYQVIDAETGYSKTGCIQGAEAMATDWAPGDEAWPLGEEEFRGSPEDVAS